MKQADVVIVGSGIIGAAAAFQIARRSALKVVVVDQADGPALGSTGDSLAISRCRYTVPDVVRIAHQSQLAYRNWSEFTGLDAPLNEYTRLGGLWMFDESSSELEQEMRVLTEAGVAASVLTIDDLMDRFPIVNPCVQPIDFSGDDDHVCRPGEMFLFEHDAGFIDPAGANADLVRAARREGVDIRFQSKVTGLLRSGEAVTGVTMADGDSISAGIVLNAAGPWCNELNDLVDAARPWTFTPTRIQLITRPWPTNAPRLPVIFDEAATSAYRIEASGERMAIVAPQTPEFTSPVASPEQLRRTADSEAVLVTMACFEHRVVGIAHHGTLTGTAGLYTINEQDTHPVLGPSELDGLWLANGFSGHGLKLAPMIGAMLATSITGESAPYDTDISMDLFANDRDPLQTSGVVFA